MDNNKIIECLYSLLMNKNVEVQNRNYIDVIKDCFYLETERIEQKGCIFLMDINKTIIAAYDYEESKKLEHCINRSIDLQFDETLQNIKLTKIFKLGDQQHSIYLYLYRTSNFNNTCYYLCTLTQNEDDLKYNKLLEKINLYMDKSIQLINKYSNHNDLLMRALDAVNDGISLCDKDGYIKYANNACYNIAGVDKENLLNKYIGDISKEKPMLLQIVENKKSIIDVEYYLIIKEKTKHLINSGYPIFNEKGDFIGAIDIFRGIERSKKLANTIAGYQAYFTFDDIIGKSKKIEENINLAKVFAQTNENILILGESGTGKELFAQSIHNYSNRREKPFIALNCANFPNELIDSELFGYDEGAFTGARKGGKIGKFELANGGTLFLDELGEMEIHLQAKLLRVLETMCVNRIGANKPISVDVRIIAATNRKLEKLVKDGRFREDLYYRLKVLCLEIPSLRERGNDVLLLSEYFIKNFQNKINRHIKGMSDEAKEVLMKHTWPGNIRELENTISRALYIDNSDYITVTTLKMAGLKECEHEQTIRKDSIKINKKIILDTLKSTNGNKKRASEILGISRPTFYKMLKKYELNQ
ncbi:sigma-54 interaction domain-containing protein [Tepidibacter mesophilus]|uniref:sigma-54 interaction domain-containing protein n=1 Tax=Tepidibacter mesophilus TaxID=655607 RepID=UPI000C06CA0C|nr:sigma 54-interacting transcriptional regulator [Tepidibacter mesophilus]